MVRPKSASTSASRAFSFWAAAKAEPWSLSSSLSSAMRLCSAATTGMEAGRTEMLARKGKSVKQKVIKASTVQLVDLGRLSIDSELRFGESPETAGIGFEKLLEDLTALFGDNLKKRAK